jgi:hypothetical protein
MIFSRQLTHVKLLRELVVAPRFLQYAELQIYKIATS